jgi:phosphohistidine phosphatase SixA
LTRGLGLNKSNPALNADMQRLLEQTGARAAAPAAGEPKTESTEQAAHVLLSAYTRPVH